MDIISLLLVLTNLVVWPVIYRSRQELRNWTTSPLNRKRRSQFRK